MKNVAASNLAAYAAANQRHARLQPAEPNRVAQRISKPSHSIGVTIAIPHSSFVPTPLMTPLEIAFAKGAEAKRFGRKADRKSVV